MVTVRPLTWAVAAALVLLAAGTAQATINIDTVPVANVGNVTDTTGYGSVPYLYNIGKYEVTAGQYTAFLNAVATVDTYGLYTANMSNTTLCCGIARSGSPGAYAYTVAGDFVNRPVSYVSFGDAMRFANWMHNGQPTGAQGPSTTEDGAYYVNGATTDSQLSAVTRKAGWRWAVTSEDEWYKAAYYDPASGHYFTYPTSSNTAPGQDLADVSGNNANCRGGATFPIQSPYYTTVVGQFRNSDSPYGTFDQGGNVQEWNEAIVNEAFRGWRGGAFNYNEMGLRALSRGHNSPTIEGYDVGFRLSAVPEPATMSLLALAGLGMLIRRRSVRR